MGCVKSVMPSITFHVIIREYVLSLIHISRARLIIKYKNEMIMGNGSPFVWISNELAIHQNMKIRYHRPKVVW